ncbi:MAG: glycosyltransferase family 4 protein [Fidelibacterota bacterium]|nr:MAG: glycosyltransferase family 4 protein [Candidatus Neomarinimicrobiota bacterium]
MKLGILTRDEPVYSLLIYREKLKYEFSALGIETVDLADDDPNLDNIDLVWEPGLFSVRFPHPKFQHCSLPVVGTIHGLAGLSLSIREYFPDPFEAEIGQAFQQEVTADWEWFSRKVAKVIAVSKYGAEEIISQYKVPRNKVTFVYHGVAHDIFKEDGPKIAGEKPYLLQIAQFAPKKNVDRVLEAYIQLPEETRPELVVILPNYEGADPEIPGVRIIREGMTQEELAPWYRGAMGFIFPSIHETFGMPVLEAMACGCPVITSNTTALPELTGEAALLVNPRSVEEIFDALSQLVNDPTLRRKMRKVGLGQSRLFTWEKSAREHLKVFESVLT